MRRTLQAEKIQQIKGMFHRRLSARHLSRFYSQYKPHLYLFPLVWWYSTINEFERQYSGLIFGLGPLTSREILLAPASGYLILASIKKWLTEGSDELPLWYGKIIIHCNSEYFCADERTCFWWCYETMKRTWVAPVTFYKKPSLSIGRTERCRLINKRALMVGR